MPRRVVKDNNRIALRVQAADKAVIMRAASVAQTDMTELILRAALREARSVIEEHERVKLTGRDSLRVLELLENPPAPMPSCEKPRAPCRSRHEPAGLARRANCQAARPRRV